MQGILVIKFYMWSILGKDFKCLDSMVFDIYFHQERKLQSNSVDCGVLHLKQGKIFK